MSAKALCPGTLLAFKYKVPHFDANDEANGFKRDFNDEYCAVRDVEAARALNGSLQSFDQRLARNASKIPIE